MFTANGSLRKRKTCRKLLKRSDRKCNKRRLIWATFLIGDCGRRTAALFPIGNYCVMSRANNNHSDWRFVLILLAWFANVCAISALSLFVEVAAQHFMSASFGVPLKRRSQEEAQVFSLPIRPRDQNRHSGNWNWISRLKANIICTTKLKTVKNGFEAKRR